MRRAGGGFLSVDLFIHAMVDAGIEPVKPIDIVDGRMTRFRAVGDKPGARNAWCVHHSSPTPHGAFGSWRTGADIRWRPKPPLGETRAQRAERRSQLEAVHRQRLAEQEAVRAAARERAARLWQVARPATDDHPYLRDKGVHAYGIRRLRDMLVIAARDSSGQLTTLQFIGVDGTKRFLTGGRIEGSYFSIGTPRGSLYLAEGYASAATVYEATGDAVAVCFSCGNLKAVALALRAKFPTLRMVIAADNDEGTPGNPGVRYAFEAAAAAGALVVVPDFSGVR
jgi:putative DNA primase/helicase